MISFLTVVCPDSYAPVARSEAVGEIFRIGTCRRAYSKTRDAGRILDGKDLTVAAKKCPELKAFLNTILTLSGAECL